MNRLDVNSEIESTQELLGQLEQLLLDTKKIAKNDSNAYPHWEHIHCVSKYLRKKFSALETHLVSTGNIRDTKSGIQKLVSGIEQYKNSNDTGHLISTVTTLDGNLFHFIGLPSIRTDADIGELLRLAKSYHTYSKQQISNFKVEISKVREEKSAVEKELKDLSSTLANQVVEFSNNYKEWHDAEILKFETYANEIKEMMEKTKKEIENRKIEVDEIAGIIGAAGLAGGYRSRANWQNFTAWVWAVIALASFGIWIYGVFLHIFPKLDQPSDWVTVVRQLFSSTPFILLAGFAALQVTHHQRIERSNRRSALELAAIDLYLAPLELEERNEVKRTLVDKFFGQQDATTEKADNKRLLTLASEFAKIFKQIQSVTNK